MKKFIKLYLTKTEIERYTFILYIHIYHIILLLVFPAVPGIISLYIFIKEKNLENHFHNCFEIWAKLTLMTILTFTFILSFKWFLENFSMNSSSKEIASEIFVGILALIFIIFNIGYFKDLTTFRKIIEEEQQGDLYIQNKKRQIARLKRKKTNNKIANRKEDV